MAETSSSAGAKGAAETVEGGRRKSTIGRRIGDGRHRPCVDAAMRRQRSPRLSGTRTGRSDARDDGRAGRPLRSTRRPEGLTPARRQHTPVLVKQSSSPAVQQLDGLALLACLRAARPKVSRAWYQNLRSLVVLKPNLENWYNGAASFQGVDLDFCRRKARSIHAFRSASPSALPDSAFRISTNFAVQGTQFAVEEQVLSGDHLIWLASGHRRIYVVNLRSLTSKTIVPLARECLRSLCASDELVAAATNAPGVVYVGELTGQDPMKRFRIVAPNSALVVTCRHRSVACAAMRQDGILVYIWNYDTQQGRSFTLGYGTLTNQLPTATDVLALLLQPQTETIILCLQTQPRSQTDASLPDPQLHSYRFTYSGDCLNNTAHVLEGYYHRVNPNPNDLRSMRFTPADQCGLFMVDCRTRTYESTTRFSYSLQFDESLLTFTPFQHPRLSFIEWFDEGQVVWWKDTCIEAGIIDQIIVHRGTISNSRNNEVQAYDPLDLRAWNPRERQIASKDLHINDRYMVRPYCDAFYVYCYDHTVHLPGEEGTLAGVGPWKVIEPSFASVSGCIAAMDDGM
ncbi:hypothetical protein OPT61_g7173 [Boeremia exigua]|uniref:Uncharacterized protein n=1 Tax=Boeremia exigua TaxID=749465 RepID=A0ACC2I3B9_9PLEO|nr:hypothetical protein OPT61_g7173 [Boeremia exigua]